jgi:hypothetical protein
VTEGAGSTGCEISSAGLSSKISSGAGSIGWMSSLARTGWMVLLIRLLPEEDYGNLMVFNKVFHFIRLV